MFTLSKKEQTELGSASQQTQLNGISAFDSSNILYKQHVSYPRNLRGRRYTHSKSYLVGTSLVVQWLTLLAPKARGPCIETPGQERHPYSATKTWCRQRNNITD